MSKKRDDRPVPIRLDDLRARIDAEKKLISVFNPKVPKVPKQESFDDWVARKEVAKPPVAPKPKPAKFTWDDGNSTYGDDFEQAFSGGSYTPSNYFYDPVSLSKKSTGKKDKKEHGSCYEKHPALVLPGTDKVIYGGSCGNPVIKDADVYIGFDEFGMRWTSRSWPWKQGAEFVFPVKDMSIPEHPKEFVKLVQWAKAQVDAGKKVHCGCVGGHGRTGMFLAALCSAYGESDAVTYVRARYCEKAVESVKQIDFLHEEFGIKKLAAAKKPYSGKFVESGLAGGSTAAYGDEIINPVPAKHCIWGD